MVTGQPRRVPPRGLPARPGRRPPPPFAEGRACPLGDSLEPQHMGPQKKRCKGRSPTLEQEGGQP
eukprot:15446271-Alexandrium_andersonii.AAC.1